MNGVEKAGGRPAAGLPAPILRDAAWCWWTRPRAVRLGPLVYVAALDQRGQVFVATWDLERRVAQRTVLAGFEDDDHNNPALVTQAGHPLVAFYSRHGQDDAVRYRVSERPGDIAAWSQERTLEFGGTTTYAQVHARGSELHLFTRVDGTKWSYRRSPDWAARWESPRDFLSFDTDQQIYMPTALLPDGRTVRVAVSGHPKEYYDKPLHNIWACQVDLETGAVTLPSTGQVVGNLATGAGLPLGHDRLELVHATPPDRTANLFDVGDGPGFEIGFVSKVKDDHATVDARYHVTTLHGSQWRTEDLTPSGTIFGYLPVGLYVGGMAFPHRSPGGRVYLTREEAGQWHLERWDRRTDGAWSPLALLAPTSTRLARPWAVTDPAGDLQVVALALEHYDDGYFGSLSHLVGASATGPYQPFPSIT